MTTSDYAVESRKRGGAGSLLLITFALLIFAGAALSVGAYIYADHDLTVLEAVGAGYGIVGGVIVGLFGAIIGLVAGLFGALLGVAAAGGAVALTLFIVGSPIIAIILFVLLMRGRKSDCPDPDAHRMMEE